MRYTGGQWRCILLGVLLLVIVGQTAVEAQEAAMLVGETTREGLFREFPTFLDGYRKYTPGKDAVEKIARINGPFDILVFLGTWCGDSISEVPKILKALDAADNQDLRLILYGVDRSMKESLGRSEKFNVRRVPTTIVLRNGTELGRIVEYPQKSSEEDLLKILVGNQ